MARVMDGEKGVRPDVPVLSSPELGVLRLKTISATDRIPIRARQCVTPGKKAPGPFEPRGPKPDAAFAADDGAVSRPRSLRRQRAT